MTTRPTLGQPLDGPDGGSLQPVSAGSPDDPGVAAASDEDRDPDGDLPKGDRVPDTLPHDPPTIPQGYGLEGLREQLPRTDLEDG